MAAAGAAAGVGSPLHSQPPFDDLFAAIGWHPAHRRLLQLLANATSAGGGLDPAAASLAAALLQGSWEGGSALGKGPHGGGSGGGSGGGGGGSDPSGPVNISLLGLLFAALVIGVNGLISLWLRLGLHGKLAVATVRCFAQLSLLGYILVPIFLANRWWLTLLYSLFMLAVAAIESVSRPAQTYNGMLLQVLGALGLASSAVISYGLALVVQVSPWYDPQYLIPMLGMLLGNACSGVAVGLSTILDELSTGRDKVEVLLAMGATRMEATRDVVQRAARMALTPLLNTMNVVGIVSIPGMMTGQILGGSDPATAARYQIIIMLLIGAATGLSSVAAIFLAVFSLLDDHHRLRSERLRPRPSGAKGAVAWLGAQLSQGWWSTRAGARQLGRRLRLAFGPRAGRRGGGAATAASAGYRPLPAGGASGSGAAGDGEADSVGIPSRLQEVLVAGSVGSSTVDLGSGGSPPAAAPLLWPPGSAGSRASSGPAWSPARR
ncbi:hypothetical protein ABPG75_012464 [Micractinium tetrahymenae]